MQYVNSGHTKYLAIINDMAHSMGEKLNDVIIWAGGQGQDLRGGQVIGARSTCLRYGTVHNLSSGAFWFLCSSETHASVPAKPPARLHRDVSSTIVHVQQCTFSAMGCLSILFYQVFESTYGCYPTKWQFGPKHCLFVFCIVADLLC